MDFRLFPRRRVQDSSERGAILIITALVMMVMLMVAAFATDLGAWYRQAQEQQRSADLGSLNGIQSYEDLRREEFGLAGASSWADIPEADRVTLERDLLEEAVGAVIGVLNAAGSNVVITPSNPDWTNASVTDPGATPPAESSVSFETSDGMTVIVTRTVDLTISVSVSQTGTQYFSSLVTGAPTIERISTATLSNCGAVCNVPITLEPPFVGFQSTSSGDGFAPLLYEAGNQVWAVNHHRRRGDTRGEIVCMDIETREFCGGSSATGLHSLNTYGTHNRPAEEYLSPTTGKLYFTAYDWDLERSGLVCFNTVTENYCGFTELWDQLAHDRWSAQVNATGPWVYNNQMYIMSQDGQLACVNFSMGTCGMWNTSVFGSAHLPAVDNPSELRMVNGEMVGDRIYFTHLSGSRTIFSCWDIGSANQCGWSGPVEMTYLDGREDRRQTFLRHNTGGTPTHICVQDLENTRNGCVALAGNTTMEIAGLSGHLSPLMNNWAGDAFTFQGKYTFFAGGNSNLTGCWSWITQSECGLLDHRSVGFEPSKATDPYAYAEVNDSCVIGLSDKSVYFSFKPTDMTPCVETTASAPLVPCDCANNDQVWGTLFLPDELLNKVDMLRGTVTDDTGHNWIDDVDLLAAGGAIDLSGVPATGPNKIENLTLHLTMDTKLDGNGQPIWTDPITEFLELVVQPTLSG